MTSQSPSTLDSVYQLPVLLIDLDSVSTFGPDRDSNPLISHLDFWQLHATIHDESPLDNWSGGIIPDNPSNALTNHGVGPTDLKSLFDAELANKKEKVQQIHLAYQARIEALHGYAIPEGFTIKEISKEDFWSFLRSTFYTRKAALFLMDNGNLRAVWQDDTENHIGLQFLGNQLVEYVIFKRRSVTRDVSRVAGIDMLDGIKMQIRAFGLALLMGE